MFRVFLSILVLASIVCKGQTNRETVKDTTITLPAWHAQQLASLDAEVKRLQATTIEAEVRRVNERKDIIVSALLADRMPLSLIIPESLQLLSDRIIMKVSIPATTRPATKPK